MGFITSDSQTAILQQTGKNLVSVFIPTTPNPTSGFLVLVTEDKVNKLEMSVADGLKYIVSLGAILPERASVGTGARSGAFGEELKSSNDPRC